MTVDERERVREFYERQAQQNPRHAAVLGEPNDFARAYREYQELKVFRSLLSSPPPARFVEFGSGGGRWLEAMAPVAKQCIGVEFSGRCVEVSRARLERFANVVVHQSAIQDFRLESQVDLLYFSGVLLYLPDEELLPCLRAHLEHLSSGGHVMIRDTVALGETHQWRHPQDYVATYRSIDDWQRMMTALGLRLDSRAVANERPISDRVKRSWPLRAMYQLARRCGTDRSMLTWVSNTFGHAATKIVQEAEYSHDFLLFHVGCES